MSVNEDSKETELLIESLMKRFPKLTPEFARILLDDCSYNPEETMKVIAQNEELLNTSMHSFEIHGNDPLESLVNIFPMATKKQINAVLAKSKYDIELAASLLAEMFLTGDYTILDDKKEEKKRYKYDHDPKMNKLIELYPNLSYHLIKSTLESVDWNIDSAAIILSNAGQEEDYLKILLEMFPQYSKEQIEDILFESDFNFDKSVDMIINGELEEKEEFNIINKTKKYTSPAKEKPYGFMREYDLHGMNLEQALFMAKVLIQKETQDGTYGIIFITGKGQHSQNKNPILRPAIYNLCTSMGYKAAIPLRNEGSVICHFQD